MFTHFDLNSVYEIGDNKGKVCLRRTVRDLQKVNEQFELKKKNTNGIQVEMTAEVNIGICRCLSTNENT